MKGQIQITCPNCKKTIPNNSVIDSAVRGEFHGSAYVTCDCGETITYWAITAQLRDQQTPGQKFKSWFQELFKG